MINELQRMDLLILPFFYGLRSPLLNSIMIGVSNLGGGIVVILGIIVFIYLCIKQLYIRAFKFAFIILGSVAVNSLLKIAFHRARPQMFPLVVERDFSFPSGHAMNSLVFYFILSYLFLYSPKNLKRNLLVAVISLTLVLLIGVSRVYLGVHYPTDVIAGYLFGMVWLLCTIPFMN